MKRFIVSTLLALALLTAGLVGMQHDMVSTAYAEDGGGSD